MTTIETFCRNCKEPVDILMPYEEDDSEIIAAVGRIGVSLCEKCRPARKQSVPKPAPTPPKEFFPPEFIPRIVGNPHNDP